MPRLISIIQSLFDGFSTSNVLPRDHRTAAALLNLCAFMDVQVEILLGFHDLKPFSVCLYQPLFVAFMSHVPQSNQNKFD